MMRVAFSNETRSTASLPCMQASTSGACPRAPSLSCKQTCTSETSGPTFCQQLR